MAEASAQMGLLALMRQARLYNECASRKQGLSA